MKLWKTGIIMAAAAGATVGLYVADGDKAELIANVDPSCTESGAQPVYRGESLDTLTRNRAGVVWDDGGAGLLRLKKVGGDFRANGFATQDSLMYVCSWDFDEDGWEDIVGGDGPNDKLVMYKNFTYEDHVRNPPDWTAGSDYVANPILRVPTNAELNGPPGDNRKVFIEHADGNSSSRLTLFSNILGGSGGHGTMLCGDFNNDGHGDFFYIRGTNSNLNRAEIYLGDGTGRFPKRYQGVPDKSALADVTWSANPAQIVNWDSDPFPDMVYGSDNGSRDGKIQVYLNDGDPVMPRFVPNIVISNKARFGSKGVNALSVADFDADGDLDVLASGVSSGIIKLYPGPFVDAPNNDYDPPSTLIDTGSPGSGMKAFPGGATTFLMADFTLDGLPDFVAGVDNFNYNSNNGGESYLWVNKGGTNPFGKYEKQLTKRSNPAYLPVNDPLCQPQCDPTATTCKTSEQCAPRFYDYDVATVMQLDNDPDGTPDVILSDGNNVNAYQIALNRARDVFTPCGTVTSDKVDLGALESVELTVASVTLDPEYFTPTGGSVTFDVSNDGGSSWHAAQACPDDASKFCVAFSNSVGKEIKWRAKMCAPAPHYSVSPKLTEMELSYTYVTAANHFRAGPIATEGVIYVGAFREPGKAGEFFALDDSASGTIPSVLWKASEKIAAQGARTMYTTTTSGNRLNFSTSNAGNPDLHLALQVPDAASATSVINWQRSARFGLNTKQALGAIENSTAAVIGPPNLPYWYPYSATSAETRTELNKFVTDNATRPSLAFVGARDGALHAFVTDPESPGNPQNGTEAWAFIPVGTAGQLVNDKAVTDATGQLSVTSYPDGSPTLADVKIDDDRATVLIMGAGNGGKYVFALDVTDPLDPQPLWHFQDPNMGRTYSKPTVVRLKDSTDGEKWLAVFASGPGLTTDVGDSLYAVNIGTGELAWEFNLGATDTYISSDITAVETDDDLEPGSPKKDGFIDRIIFADSKGRVWKLDPAATPLTDPDSGKPYITSIGDVSVSDSVHQAIFDVSSRAVLGGERVIAGTIAAADDLSGRLTLYFGTGGTDETVAVQSNAFYAVHADNGEVRNELTELDGESFDGAKFYGGVVYNDGQIIFSTGKDLSGVGLCAPTEGQIFAVDAHTFALLWHITTDAKIVAPVFATGGTFYTTNMKGEVVASAYVGQTSGGGGGGGPTPGSGGEVEGADGFDIMGWRQIE